MRTIWVFIQGMREFRSSYTYHYYEFGEPAAYDWGREFMHRITFRRFDQ